MDAENKDIAFDNISKASGRTSKASKNNYAAENELISQDSGEPSRYDDESVANELDIVSYESDEESEVTPPPKVGSIAKNKAAENDSR